MRNAIVKIVYLVVPLITLLGLYSIVSAAFLSWDGDQMFTGFLVRLMLLWFGTALLGVAVWAFRRAPAVTSQSEIIIMGFALVIANGLLLVAGYPPEVPLLWACLGWSWALYMCVRRVKSEKS